MVRGVIEGREAWDYLKSRKPNSEFDKFILHNVKSPNRVCDLCCGHGNTIQLLKKKAKRIIGIDASKEMIRICTKRFKGRTGIKLLNTSATHTGLSSQSFDHVIIRMGLHHIKDKEELMDEVHRILKPKGKVIIIDKFYPSIFSCVKQLLRVFLLDFSHFKEYVKSKQYNEWLLSRRFDIIKKGISPMLRGKNTQVFKFVLQKRSL